MTERDELVRRLRNEADRIDPPSQHEFNERGQRLGHPGNVVMLLRKAADALTAQPAQEQNQCDGCARGLAIRNGLHVDERGHAVQACTANRYAPPSGIREGMMKVDDVEQRILTWRQRFVNKSGDQLALDDFMGQESIDDFIDFVCDETRAANGKGE